MYVRPVEGLYDSALVFTDPLDLDLYQATKALEHAAPVVDEGGFAGSRSILPTRLR